MNICVPSIHTHVISEGNLLLYVDTCPECNHVICVHNYTFEVVENKYQQFTMDCPLCGSGDDQHNIDPDIAPDSRYDAY